MNIILKYEEIEEMILAKSGQKITLSYVDEKTIRCSYTLSMFGFNKDIHIDVTIMSVENNIVTATIADSTVVNMLVEQIGKHIDTNKVGIEIENGVIKIDLTRIERIGKVLEHVTLSDIVIEEQGVNIEALVLMR